MTKEKAINAYNLVCRIEELEKFIEVLNNADKVSIKIDYSKSRNINSTYSFTLYDDEMDDIKEILAVMTKKLDTLKKKLDSI